MTTPGLPPPSWAMTEITNKPTRVWYSYLKAADDVWRPKVVSITSASSITVLTNSGLSMMESVPASTYLIADPTPGCRKTLCVVSTSTTGSVRLESTSKFFRPGSGWVLTFGSSSAHKTVELMGISTSEYLIVSNLGGITVTTA